MSTVDLMDQQWTDDEGPRHGRRRVRRVVGRTLLLLVVLAALAGWLLRIYQPLRAGSLGGATTLSADGKPEPGTVTAEPAWVIPYAPGGRFAVIVVLRNSAPVAIRVSGLWAGELHPVANPESFPGAFTLGAGEQRFIRLSYRFRNCGAPTSENAAVVVRDQPVEVVAWQLHRTVQVPLVAPVVITHPGRC